MKKWGGIAMVIIAICGIFLYARNIREYPADEPKMQEDISGGAQETGEVEEQTESNEEEKGYSDTWIKEHVMGVKFGYNEYVTQNDIKQIGQMQNLKQLDIHISGEDEIDLSPLKNLTELESLNIVIAGTVDLSFLENMSKLEELYIEVGNEPIDLSPLGSLVHLRKLTMEAILAGSQDVSFLENLNQLRDICIWKWCDLKDLSVFQNMSYLQELRVCYVEDVDLNYLRECTNLKTLEIIGGNIRNAKGLTDLERLEYLSLYDNNYYSDTERLTFDLHPLSEMIELKSVGLIYINVDDISPLSELKGLHSILLVRTGIGDIESLKNLERLESLHIFGNVSERVKEQAEEYFNELQNVEVTENIPNGLLL